MGRPLNKKYFGNRNIGTGGYQVDETTGTANARNYADDRIGGEGVASYSISNQGSYRIDATHAIPTIAVDAPLIPGGVQTTFNVVWEVDTLSVINGTTGQNYSNAVATLSGLTSGTSYPFTFAIATNGSGVHEPQTFTITSRGEWAGTPPTVNSSYAVVQAGSNGLAQVVVYYRIKSITVNEKGSGYTTTPAVSFTGGTLGTLAVSATVLTVDTGAVGSATNQENAILMTARLTGGSATTVDIIRQVSTNRYKVTDGTRTGIVKLKSSVATAAGEGSVRLVDSVGGTYFATKITAHKATIVRGTGSQAAFVTGTAVKWNMTAATADSLLIDNA